MNGVISRLSKYGLQVNGADTWLNLSKYSKDVTLDGLNKGDTVDYEQNNKGYLTKLVKLGAGAAVAGQYAGAATSATATPSAAVQAVFGAGARDDQKDLRITRLSALSTAFGALASLGSEGDSVEDTLVRAEALAERLTRYATTGKFAAEESKSLAEVK